MPLALHQLGEVKAVGRFTDEDGLIAEVTYKLGFGTQDVWVPWSMIAKQADRVVVEATYDEIDQSLFNGEK
jgi:hypothetical protein